ncbi:hypothetical protein Mal4_00140 [Maioricimonas rarisocia]|uniref:Glycosyltransferase RgtA/B/C/D-like domain-containing protein n=1 Tax=Maioricimonas rarisocia TaxID=2528026 RepID=A0A517YZU6_9PLAN|nr:glycosyltransferase family 39 protein [Maioricimonas rarisocia]QDU35732.1 hypothetical protein Mal4_00140 [Maioricimonas rarisocia]
MTSQRLVKWLILLLMLAAAGCAVAGCMPIGLLRPLGAILRRPDDVTPERYARYLHVCWFFAAAFGVAAFLVRRFRRNIEEYIRACREETREPIVAEIHERRYYLLTLLLIAVGLGLRFSRLFDPMAYDEAYTFLTYARRPWIIAIADYNALNNHLLNSFLMHWSYRLLGDAEWALRMPVFLVGGLTLVVASRWSRQWFGPRESCLVTAMVTVSPMMITYSANARGYMFVAVTTLVLDAAMWRMHCYPARSARSALIAWCAIVAGCLSMPIMLYGVLGCCGWYFLQPFFDRPLLATVVRQRATILAVLLASSGLVVMTGYAPAYIFRGLLIAGDLASPTQSGGPFLTQVGLNWAAAYEWWTAGAVPTFVWLPLAIVGLIAWPATTDLKLRWVAPFAAMFLLNLVMGALPPTRVYLFLAPWFYLAVARGITTLLDLVPDWSGRGVLLTGLALAVAGSVYTARHTVLFDPAERTSYVSIRELIDRLEEEVTADPGNADRLIAPLPSDLPAVFYLDQAGLPIPVNGEPQEGETVWLITRHGESPADVLTSPLVQLDEYVDRLAPWKSVAAFRTLRLYRSSMD